MILKMKADSVEDSNFQLTNILLYDDSGLMTNNHD